MLCQERRFDDQRGGAGNEADVDGGHAHLQNSLILVTALNLHIGYEKATRISATAHHEDLSLREAAFEE